ncbi:hypothetical protein [Pseudonocardia sp. HH130630-07]|uniref:hypothetical protein n=1 Tax=Pseudonocardia sp. HH130630-07 TaxID=1690815 RepID=UPI000814C90E|nr:hypothetical protein [Pseudonocardia sp. HH130630-07]ANY09546.1 hypothetical protein AFB00_28610 [Pseudonocardia sp. HH130630-07]
MSATVAERPVDPAGPPAAVRQSVVLWLGAILAGVAEALVHLAGPVPPTGPELAVRAGIYLVLAVLVLQLHTGRDAIRWTVVVVLGVFGTLSLVVEPFRALLAGASAAEFLVAASGPELLAAALRALHVAEVLAALVLLFHPAARRFFRGPQRVPAGIR